MSEEIETIKHAAVISFNRKWFIGKCHADCFHKAFHVKVPMSQKAEDQGFITSNGRYVQRGEAYRVALAAGQIEESDSIDLDDPFQTGILEKVKLLFSEDLWSEQHNGKFNYDEIKGYIPRKPQ